MSNWPYSKNKAEEEKMETIERLAKAIKEEEDHENVQLEI